MDSDKLVDLVEQLLVSREEALRRLAAAAKGVLTLERETGRPIFTTDLGRVTQRDRLLLELAADCLAAVVRLADERSKRDNLSQRTGIDSRVINARVKELRDAGWLLTTKEGDTLTTQGIIKATQLIEALDAMKEERVSNTSGHPGSRRRANSVPHEKLAVRGKKLENDATSR